MFRGYEVSHAPPGCRREHLRDLRRPSIARKAASRSAPTTACRKHEGSRGFGNPRIPSGGKFEARVCIRDPDGDREIDGRPRCRMHSLALGLREHARNLNRRTECALRRRYWLLSPQRCPIKNNRLRLYLSLGLSSISAHLVLVGIVTETSARAASTLRTPIDAIIRVRARFVFVI